MPLVQLKNKRFVTNDYKSKHKSFSMRTDLDKFLLSHKNIVSFSLSQEHINERMWGMPQIEEYFKSINDKVFYVTYVQNVDFYFIDKTIKDDFVQWVQNPSEQFTISLQMFDPWNLFIIPSHTRIVKENIYKAMLTWVNNSDMIYKMKICYNVHNIVFKNLEDYVAFKMVWSEELE